MKLFTQNVVYIAIIVMLPFLQSCQSRIQFEKSAVVPGAEGWVKVDKDKNDNYKIELSVERLAEPDQLTPSKGMYLVWVATEQNGARNVGLLKTAPGALSKELKSSLTTTTPYKPMSIFITAEDSANATVPGTVVVLKAAVTQN